MECLLIGGPFDGETRTLCDNTDVYQAHEATIVHRYFRTLSIVGSPLAFFRHESLDVDH